MIDMRENRTTIGIVPYDRIPQPREGQAGRRVFTGVISHCQLLFDQSGALFEFTLPPKTIPIFIGRATTQSNPPINIDLTAFNGSELGVSRTHARFERTGSRLFIRDLNSTNGTWINGSRLTPMNVHEIFHGDKIEFGRLPAQFFIKT